MNTLTLQILFALASGVAGLGYGIMAAVNLREHVSPAPKQVVITPDGEELPDRLSWQWQVYLRRYWLPLLMFFGGMLALLIITPFLPPHATDRIAGLLVATGGVAFFVTWRVHKP